MPATLDGPARALFAAPNYAHLSVPRRDGTIQNLVVWVDVDADGRLIVNSTEGRAWIANLRRAGHATLSVHNPENPYEYVAVTARLTADRHEGAEDMVNVLARKYMGVDRYPGLGDGQTRVTFVFTPERVTHYGADA
jgi:PPOX class probable F420-dependent enzyme